MLIETCAGCWTTRIPRECIRRELREETGFEIQNVQKVMEAYMSPGSVTEIVYFFVAEYTPAQQASAGGGVEEEDIEVIELTIDEATAKDRVRRDPRRQDHHAAAVRSVAYIQSAVLVSRALPVAPRLTTQRRAIAGKRAALPRSPSYPVVRVQNL